MQLLPESIRATKTNALDATWATRLKLLRCEQLIIDLPSETSEVKLSLWLEMFGIQKSLIDELELETEEYRRLLQNIIVINKLSGTIKSLQLLGLVLGAESVEVIQDYTFKYDGNVLYSGTNIYDGGELVSRFFVKIIASGVNAANHESFIEKYKRLFAVTQPAWLYLESIEHFVQ